MNDKYNI